MSKLDKAALGEPDSVAPSTADDVFLSVRDLRIHFDTDDGLVRSVDGVSFDVRKGKTLGIVGESGSGKSVTSLGVMGLHRSARAKVSGEVWLDGQELIAADPDEVRRLRGRKMAMIFQDPLSAMHPYYTVGQQIVEAYRVHHDVSKKVAKQRAVEMLDRVGIPEPAKRVDGYPHEFSGGMRQRAMIAMALVNNPELLIADEPTTALDVTVQAQILDLIHDLQKEFGSAVIMITHDLGVVAEMADDLLVMYGGRCVERGPAEDVFSEPRHPYTWGLLGSMPRMDREETDRLIPIKGAPPSLINLPSGCAFNPRCPYADIPKDNVTRTVRPELTEVGGGHWAACHMTQERRERIWTEEIAAEAVSDEKPVSEPDTSGATLTKDSAADGEILLKVTGLQKHFPIRKGLLQRQTGAVRAVDGIDFEVRRGETLGVVGESGCGKSTMGRLITRLLEPTGGTVEFEGKDITHLGTSDLRPMRRDVQMIFQDPYSSLNPRHTIGTIVGAPFRLQGVEPEGGVKKEVQRLLSVVGLNPEHYNRYPHEFSGGQRQRIGIARALALNPKLVVADEPVSALDVSIQAQVVNLLDDLQEELGLTYVIIAHDLSVVRHVSDRIAVMYLGKIVELAERDQLYKSPMHPYSKALLSAVPIPDPKRRGVKSERILLKGDVPSPISPPSGCRFHTRCWKATQMCKTTEPPLVELRAGQRVACHHPENFEDQQPQDTQLLSSAKEVANGSSVEKAAPGESVEK
ncbi:putative ABC transporter ATP-binding protein [Streptomyces purpurascens]